MSEYQLRPVCMDDAKLILDARNSKSVRVHMCNQHDIGWQEHEEWLKRRIAHMAQAPYCLFLAGQKPMGVVGISRYDESDNSGEWGFYLLSEKAPKGTGTMMLSAFCELAFENCGMVRLDSRVKASNEKSIHLHRKLGFVGAASDLPEIIAFTLDAKSWRKQRTAYVSMIQAVKIKEAA